MYRFIFSFLHPIHFGSAVEEGDPRVDRGAETEEELLPELLQQIDNNKANPATGVPKGKQHIENRANLNEFSFSRKTLRNVNKNIGFIFQV